MSKAQNIAIANVCAYSLVTIELSRFSGKEKLNAFCMYIPLLRDITKVAFSNGFSKQQLLNVSSPANSRNLGYERILGGHLFARRRFKRSSFSRMNAFICRRLSFPWRKLSTTSENAASFRLRRSSSFWHGSLHTR